MEGCNLLHWSLVGHSKCLLQQEHTWNHPHPQAGKDPGLKLLLQMISLESRVCSRPDSPPASGENYPGHSCTHLPAQTTCTDRYQQGRATVTSAPSCCSAHRAREHPEPCSHPPELLVLHRRPCCCSVSHMALGSCCGGDMLQDTQQDHTDPGSPHAHAGTPHDTAPTGLLTLSFPVPPAACPSRAGGLTAQ